MSRQGSRSINLTIAVQNLGETRLLVLNSIGGQREEQMIKVLAISLYLSAVVALTQAPSSGSIHGIVLDGEHRPLAGAKVYGLREENMLQQIPTTADDAGRFVLSNVAPGAIYLSAFKEDEGYPYNFFSFFIMPGQNMPKVNVRAGETISDVVIQLGARAAYLEIHITDENGMPSDHGAQLVFTRPDLPGDYRRGARSRESLMVPPVPFRLAVEAKGYEVWRYGGKNWQQKAGLISLKSGETLTIVCPLKRKPK
jgi:hypothetical protein